MQGSDRPIVKDLVLVGGGHAHAIALRQWGMQPLPGVRLTLVSDTAHAAYSGMLPGHVAGFYSYDQAHIDLRRLARFAGAQFYRDRATGLDLARNRVLCRDRPPVAFDCVSLDTGSVPAADGVPGAAEHAIPAKPVPVFLQAWNELLAQVRAQPEAPVKIAIVGGGAGGVELALNAQRRLHGIVQAAGCSPEGIQIALIQRGACLLPDGNRWSSRYLAQLLRARGIALHLQQRASEVHPDRVVCDSGLTVACDRAFWVTRAAAPDWLAASGLATDARGFALVGETLQSVSHPQVFAAGDVAAMQHHPRPKAGVFAVRQGKPLARNLRRFLRGWRGRRHVPQRHYLRLIGTGDGRAIAAWGPLGWHAALLWRWKDRIDRRFMQHFAQLPAMDPPERDCGSGDALRAQLAAQPRMYCAGCGSKVGSSVLERVLARLHPEEGAPVALGLDAPDDAAVVRVPADKLMVHTLDAFTAPLADPYTFGQIAAHHCLSDLYAMGATPQSALALATVPHAAAAPTEETLYQLLAGTTQVLQAERTPLVGGHTVQGSELALGLACNGLVAPERLRRKSGLGPDQALILTQALGTGTLLAAHMRYAAQGRWIEAAIAAMLRSNQAAAEVAIAHEASALTDVTGYGLAGHLLEILQASGVAAELALASVPVLPGAVETARAGLTSSLQPQNQRAAERIAHQGKVAAADRYPLLFDPQTSGGLLVAVPEGNAQACLAALRDRGYPESEIVGRTMPAQPRSPLLILR